MVKKEFVPLTDDLNEVICDGKSFQNLIDDLMESVVPRLVESHTQKAPEVLTKVNPGLQHGFIVIKIKNQFD